MKSEGGFTLLETLLVLMITSSLILLPVLSIDKMIESTQTELFFRELSSRITMMQNHSIMNGEKTSVDFFQNEAHFIRFQVDGNSVHPLNSRMYLDKSLVEFSGSGYQKFSFAKDTGTINGMETIRFNTSQGVYKLTYLLGSGRVGIEKN